MKGDHMAKALKYSLIGLASVVVLVALLGGIFMVKLRSEKKQMTPTTTQRVVDGVYSIQDTFVNFFLVNDNDTSIVIDAGNDIKNAKTEIDKLGVDLAKVSAVFLTHTDADHTAAIKLFPNAKIYISTKEEPLLTGEIHKIPFVKNKVDGHYELLRDGQVIRVGSLSIKAILTSGHTPGSLSYLVNGTYLFTGDTLALINGQAELFNDFFNMDTKTEGQSLKKLAKITTATYLFTSHYGVSSDFNKAIEKWRH
jgi:glyoxylase-like metal-dependent hydrolase (beta-lactamase superfamily II)